MSKLTKTEKPKLRAHALERAEFFFNLAQSDSSFAEIAEITSWEWLFVYATGDYLG